MSIVWRILGFQLLAELGARLPARAARIVTVTLLVVANLVPIVGVAVGWMTTVDVFVTYWVENLVVLFFTLVRFATATKPEPDREASKAVDAIAFTLFFSIANGLYGGLLYVLLGVFDVEIRDHTGWLWAAAAIFLSHLLSLVIHWFGGGERHAYASTDCTKLSVLRVVVLHVSVVGGFFLLFAFPHPVTPVVLMVVVKVGIDVVMHLRERAKAAAAVPALAFHPDEPSRA